MNKQISLVKELTKQSNVLSKEKGIEIEKAVWIIVHEHINGFRPVEYDIREIDEDLYLSVLKNAKTVMN